MVKQAAHRPVSDPSSPRRRRRLSRAVIGRAVVEIGFDRATLVAVADHLGCNHASLYGHVKNRDDMVLAGVELVLDELPPLQVEGEWPQLLRAEAWAVFELFVAHPALDAAVELAPAPPAQVTARFTHLANRLLADGFDPSAALSAAQIVYHQATAMAAQEVLSGSVEAAQVEGWEQGIAPSLDPLLVAAMHENFSRDSRARFDEMWDLLLAGIAARYSPG